MEQEDFVAVYDLCRGVSDKLGRCVAPSCPDPYKQHRVYSNIDYGEAYHRNGIAMCNCGKEQCLLKAGKLDDIICLKCVAICKCRTDRDNTNIWVCSLSPCPDCGTPTCDIYENGEYVSGNCGHSCYVDQGERIIDCETYPIDKEKFARQMFEKLGQVLYYKKLDELIRYTQETTPLVTLEDFFK